MGLRDLGDLSGATGRHEAARESWCQALAMADDLGDAATAAAIRSRLERRGPGRKPGIQAPQGQ